MASHQAECLKVSHEAIAPISSYKVRAPTWDQFVMRWGLFGVTCLCFTSFCLPLVCFLTSDWMKSMTMGPSAAVILVSPCQKRSHSRRKGRRCFSVLPERILALVPHLPPQEKIRNEAIGLGGGFCLGYHDPHLMVGGKNRKKGSTYTHLYDVVL